MGRLSEYSPDELRVMFPPPSDDVFLSLISGAHSAYLVRDASDYAGAHRHYGLNGGGNAYQPHDVTYGRHAARWHRLPNLHAFTIGRHRSNVAAIASAYVKGMAL